MAQSDTSPNPPPSRNQIRSLAMHSQGEQEQYEKLLYDSKVYPGKLTWRKFLDYFLLGLGAVLFLCGVIFFFAYNWTDLPKFGKFALILTLIMIAAGITWRLDWKGFGHKMGLLSLSILVGAFLAVYGQTYQTGANAYDFFWGWTLLITIWVLISRFPPLWFFYLVLLNTTLILFGYQVLRLHQEPFPLLFNVVFNALALGLFEYLSLQKGVHYPSRWLPRLTGLATISLLTILAAYGSIELLHGRHILGSLLSIALLIALGISWYFIYQKLIRDLFFLALLPVSAMIILLTQVIEIIGDSMIMTVFMAGFLVIGGTALMVSWLMKISRSWNSNPQTQHHDSE